MCKVQQAHSTTPGHDGGGGGGAPHSAGAPGGPPPPLPPGLLRGDMRTDLSKVPDTAKGVIEKFLLCFLSTLINPPCHFQVNQFIKI